MKNDSIIRTVQSRITDCKPGSVFVASDFTDIAKSKTVNTILARLCQEGILRRFPLGLYEYPEYNDFLGEFIAPSPDLIARAIARNFDWKISPCGANVLNQMGLSTQVPATLTYACNGAYKEYEFGKTKIKFIKAIDQDFDCENEKASMVIQAIKALGKKNVKSSILAKIGVICSDEDMEYIMKAVEHTTPWVGECLKEVYESRTQIKEEKA